MVGFRKYRGDLWVGSQMRGFTIGYHLFYILVISYIYYSTLH